MAIDNRPIKVSIIFLIWFLSACTGVDSKVTAEVPTPTIFIPTPTYFLATPYAQSPAAGICASFEGEMVKVTLYADIPDPRCIKVRPDQKLLVVNNSHNVLQISIGEFSASLEPGEESNINTPFGDYLAAGVHQLMVSPCCSTELVLEGK
jgi:hypothetical protein